MSRGVMERPAEGRCHAVVRFGFGYSGRPIQCGNRSKVEEEGHQWCFVHAPSKVRARREQADAQFRAAMTVMDREDAVARQERRLIHVALRFEAGEATVATVLLACRELRRAQQDLAEAQRFRAAESAGRNGAA